MGSSKFRYQVGLIGSQAAHASALRNTLRSRLSELGLHPETISILQDSAVKRRDRKLPFVVIYFGLKKPSIVNVRLLDELLLDSPVVLPVVDDLEFASQRLPAALSPINALELAAEDPQLERVAAFLLQQFRLLRKERRVFISYRRKESDLTAAQIYDALDERGFDVFLDTRGVPPGEDFQEVLWHRMADSDVVILLDTPGFSDSRWTLEELARANATNIQILQLLWPGVAPQNRTALCHLKLLDPDSFRRPAALPRSVLKKSVVNEVCVIVESLRARAIAARQRFLIDSICDLARSKGLKAVVYPDRSVRVDGAANAAVIVPLVGVPTSLHLEDEFVASGAGAQGAEIYVMYDERGVLRRFKAHLGWLNGSLPVRSVGVFEVTKLLDEVAS